METTAPLAPRRVRARRALLIAMPLLALVPRLWIATHALYAGDPSIFDTGFGFGGYVRSLAEEGTFRSCSFVPFDPCNAGTCTFATRMPAIPILLASLVKLVGARSVLVALAKCIVMALLSTAFLAVLSLDIQITTVGLLILYGMYFGPQVLKHGAALDYEEGVLIDLSLCLAIAVSYLLRPQQTTSAGRRAAMAVGAVVLATVMYFTKTTALLTLLVVLTIVLTSQNLRLGGKLACVLLVAAPAGLWGAHNLSSSGVFSLSSSWNGENLFRGYDSGALAIYPQISLDRLFDSQRAVLDDGTTVALGAYKSSRCFKDEWTWSSDYSHRAWNWMKEHPYPAMAFMVKKIWVTLLEIRHTPKYGSATDKRQEGSPGLQAVMIIWMLAARVVFFGLVWRVLSDLRSARNRLFGWAAVLLLAACLPYMVVFSYQRHLIPVLQFAGALLAILYFATPAPAFDIRMSRAWRTLWALNSPSDGFERKLS
jgi:hypothetical protein